MGKVLLGTLLMVFAGNAQAAVEVISTKSDKMFGIFDIKTNLFCEVVDTDKDKIKETTRLRLTLQSTVSVGVLEKHSIMEDIFFDQNDTCAKVQVIKDQSPMNFGAGFGVYDSILVLQDGVLVEDLQVTLTSHPDKDGNTVSVTLNDRIEIPVN